MSRFGCFETSHLKGDKPYHGWWAGLCFWLALFALSASAQLQRQGERQEPKWEVLSGCRLVTNQVVDGDSFHVLHKDREYIFRLYFVDAPESDAALKDRVEDQAAFFGISKSDIPRAGLLASRFTREKLTGQDITIITRWQNAMGRSSLARFYCVVMVKGENLAELLVANGLGRIKGLRANWPDGPRSATFISKLQNLELDARGKQRGVWDQAAFPLETDAATLDVGTTNAPASAVTAVPALVDLNSATFEELQKLPGIGPKLAERIIAHRPYNTLEDLDAVPGIGAATMKRLEPLIHITNPMP